MDKKLIHQQYFSDMHTGKFFINRVDSFEGISKKFNKRIKLTAVPAGCVVNAPEYWRISLKKR